MLFRSRGPRVQREHRTRAQWFCGVATLTALAAGIAAVVLTPAPARWVFAVPVVPALVFSGAVVRGQEKSLVGELAAALTLATTILPMCAAARLPPSIGVALALPYSVLFTLTTGLVRAVVVGTRSGGNATAVVRTRLATFAVALLLVGATVAGARSGAWSWVVLVMEIPALGAGSLLAVAPPSASALRRVGWTIVVVSTLTAALLMTAGRSGALRPAQGLPLPASTHAG